MPGTAAERDAIGEGGRAYGLLRVWSKAKRSALFARYGVGDLELNRISDAYSIGQIQDLLQALFAPAKSWTKRIPPRLYLGLVWMGFLPSQVMRSVADPAKAGVHGVAKIQANRRGGSPLYEGAIFSWDDQGTIINILRFRDLPEAGLEALKGAASPGGNKP